MAQSFQKLSKGLKVLEKSAGGFKSKNILGLLRSAPDLMPNIKHVQDMFVRAEKEKGSGMDLLHSSAADDDNAKTPQTPISSCQWPGRTMSMTKCKKRSRRGSKVWRRS